LASKSFLQETVYFLNSPLEVKRAVRTLSSQIRILILVRFSQGQPEGLAARSGLLTLPLTGSDQNLPLRLRGQGLFDDECMLPRVVSCHGLFMDLAVDPGV
jgi:hypothetical protein